MTEPTKPTDSAYDAPKGLACPRCKQEIAMLQDVTPDSSNHFHKGKLVVCGGCALICRVGDSKLIPVSKKEVLTFPPRIQLTLMAACRKIAENAAKN